MRAETLTVDSFSIAHTSQVAGGEAAPHAPFHIDVARPEVADALIHTRVWQLPGVFDSLYVGISRVLATVTPRLARSAASALAIQPLHQRSSVKRLV